mmetsp:Transcript_23061/g.57112  ORF Transcript_23061/g.57112 Transcript_23061/m.57112 type:complete len:264 (+) Transcript_23061:238-1029(+)
MARILDTPIYSTPMLAPPIPPRGARNVCFSCADARCCRCDPVAVAHTRMSPSRHPDTSRLPAPAPRRRRRAAGGATTARQVTAVVCPTVPVPLRGLLRHSTVRLEDDPELPPSMRKSCAAMSPLRPAVAMSGQGAAPHPLLPHVPSASSRPGSSAIAVAPPSCTASAAAGARPGGCSVSHSTSESPPCAAPARCDPATATTAGDMNATASTRAWGCGEVRYAMGGVRASSRGVSDRHTATVPSNPPAANRAPQGPQATADTAG